MKILKKILKFLIRLLLILLLTACILTAAGYCFFRWQYTEMKAELSDIYTAALTYSDPAVSRICLSAQGIEDKEAAYDSLWFLDAGEDGRDDIFIAVFRKEDRSIHIYTCFMNPEKTDEPVWEMQDAGRPDTALPVYLPKHIKKTGQFASLAVCCDGITDFTGKEELYEN